jgi:hypothetical protein
MPWKHFHVRLSVTEHARGPCHGTVKPGYKGTGYKGYLAMKVQTQVQIFLGGGSSYDQYTSSISADGCFDG